MKSPVLSFLASCTLGVVVSCPKVKADYSANELFDLSIEQLMDVTVDIATKKSESLDEAPGSISVITAAEISAMNARNLREVLNVFVPGFDVVPTYFRYGDRVNEGIYSRGLLSDFSQQILILYNGRTKFNETTFGSPFPAIEFTLENIEKIEISRSPIPLYGGSAITLINLITKEQSMKGVEAKLELSFHSGSTSPSASSFQELAQAKRFSLLWGRELDGWHLGASIQLGDDHGQAHPEANGAGDYQFDLNTLRDGTRSSNSFTLHAKTLDSKWNFQSLYKSVDQDPFLSGQVASQSQPIYTYQGSQWHASLSYKPNNNSEILLGGMRSKFVNFIDYLGEPYGGDETNFDLFAEANYTFNQFKTHHILTGLKIEREGQSRHSLYTWNGHGWDIDETDGFAPNQARNVVSAYVEDSWRVSDLLSVNAGLRIDYYRGFAETSTNKINPRIATVYKLSEKITWKTLYAKAVRPPSIYETSGTELFPLLGSQGIKPETLQTFETSLIYKIPSFKFQLTPFYQDFQDKIEYITNNNQAFIASNNGKTKVIGIDLDFKYYFDSASYVFFNGSKFSSRDQQNAQDTQFIPDIYLNGGLNYRFASWNINFTGYYRGERQLPDSLVVNKAYATGSHLRFNLSCSYLLNENFRYHITIENLTNTQDYVPLSVDGLFVPLRKTSVHAGVKIQF